MLLLLSPAILVIGRPLFTLLVVTALAVAVGFLSARVNKQADGSWPAEGPGRPSSQPTKQIAGRRRPPCNKPAPEGSTTRFKPKRRQSQQQPTGQKPQEQPGTSYAAGVPTQRPASNRVTCARGNSQSGRKPSEVSSASETAAASYLNGQPAFILS